MRYLTFGVVVLAVFAVSAVFFACKKAGETRAAETGGETTGVPVNFPSEPYSHMVPCGENLLAFTKGLSNKFILFGKNGAVTTDSVQMGLKYECFRGGACSPGGETIAVWADNNTEVWVLLLNNNGVLQKKLGPYSECGCPVYDEFGNLWYMAEGNLFKNGNRQSFPQGFTLEVDSIDVSPDGRYVAFTDFEGRIYEAAIEGGSPRIIAENKSFYPPEYTPTGQIFAATYDNEIWLFEPDGKGLLLAEGALPHPSWYVDSGGSGLEGVLYVETDDHWMDVTDSEIWIAETDGTLYQMTNTPGVAETYPEDWNNDIIAVDGITGDLVHIVQEW
ncbi:MAG: hypothetical protein JSW52_07745 [Candidatus Coatesbacteria bacterium]|nr:MAG: hypothetical protein JSW52_07745 [Candidatus Coatesbacteria bacterium]